MPVSLLVSKLSILALSSHDLLSNCVLFAEISMQLILCELLPVSTTVGFEQL